MTFTYTPESPDDVTRVRFHVEDTVEDAAILSDEEIQFAIDEAGDWKKAVVWSIDFILSRLAKESGTKLDWMEIDRGDAIKYYQRLRSDKERQFGTAVSKISASTKRVTRKDSPAS